MRELLEEFWYGNVTPQEQYTNHHPEVDELLRLADKNLTKLSDTCFIHTRRVWDPTMRLHQSHRTPII